MSIWARGEIEIPLEAWYEFLAKWAPKSDGEISFGNPVQVEGAIKVPFALNTECHPMDEAEPPEWLKPKRAEQQVNRE